ncbi:unspecific monooxygenase [Ancylostoma caninum]|uniref:Unspecific monooxygenase n=1 Tax=Ancylostoma caninum TaxID=29170 RepID=A0A368FDK6_ANCCA|nr:unspecific monooxygenase [Ancylostoma caninum]
MDEMMDNFTLFDMLIDEWSVNLPLISQRTKHLLRPLDEVLAFIRGQIEQRKKDIADGVHVIEGEGGDFVDAFLVQMKKEQNSDAPSSFDEKWLEMSLLDLWAAGQETTMVTLNWAFSYLLLHPQVKSRVVEELLSITKGQRPLSITDRPNTPYYNAMLNEVHRCAIIVPMNLWRDTSEDTVVGKYVIPKGTAISAQISVIMNDERYFKGNSNFNPDRYFSGDRVEQMVVPFGLGKRACPGESLAQAELYLMIANFLLRYEVTADPEHMPSMRARKELGTARMASSYHICFKRRQ